MKGYLARLFWFLIIGTIAGSCTKAGTETPKAKQGVLDLRQWSFNSRGIITLNGEWQFHWQKLYSPADFADSAKVPSHLMQVPGFWSDADKNLAGQGYGTYRLHVLLDSNDHFNSFGINVPDAGTAYKLWVNNEFISANGTVSADLDSMVGKARPLARNFRRSGNELDIVIQVSNNFHHKGGLWSSISLGKEADIFEARDKSLFWDILIIGALFILFVYHIGIFSLRRSESAALLFGITCLAGLLRTIVIENRVVYILFPDFNFSAAYMIEYASIPLACTLFGLFVYSFFPNEFTKLARRIILVLAVPQFLLVFLTSHQFYTGKVLWIQVITLIELLYYMVVIVRALSNRRRMAPLSFIGYFIILASCVNDILYARLLIDTTNLVTMGFFIFVLMQAYLLASKISFGVKTTENLSKELNHLNVHLEDKVVERTKELELEKRKSDELLLNILPFETAEELKQKGYSEAKQYEMVTVLFTDFVNFTEAAEHMNPKDLVGELHECFKGFDNIIARYNIEKIKTIGDAYLAVSGLPNEAPDHAQNIVKAALEIRAFMRQRKMTMGIKTFEIRVGIHSGPVVAGIVGVKKFGYDIWGDTVNTAARMEQNSVGGKINISQTTFELVKKKFDFEYRGEIVAKNKGAMHMYFVEEAKAEELLPQNAQ
jgi:class 3 adenylate cyclase